VRQSRSEQEEGPVPCAAEAAEAEVRHEEVSQEVAGEEAVVRHVVEALVQDEVVPEEASVLHVELREVAAPLVAVVASAVAAEVLRFCLFSLIVRSSWRSGYIGVVGVLSKSHGNGNMLCVRKKEKNRG
jgi:hypothetical protein